LLNNTEILKYILESEVHKHKEYYTLGWEILIREAVVIRKHLWESSEGSSKTWLQTE